MTYIVSVNGWSDSDPLPDNNCSTYINWIKNYSVPIVGCSSTSLSSGSMLYMEEGSGWSTQTVDDVIDSNGSTVQPSPPSTPPDSINYVDFGVAFNTAFFIMLGFFVLGKKIGMILHLVKTG